MVKKQKMSKSLPEDIIQEILLRLPAKSLLRFNCVSKTWCTLIHSPSFVKSHSKTSTVGIIFDNFVKCDELNQLCYESISGNLVFEEFKNPFLYSYSILGSCNGLLFISNFLMGGTDLILFNPLTRNYFKISNFFTRRGSVCADWLWGCVYDEMNDDYKLVGISVQRSSKTLGWIYSLKLGTWRRIVGIPKYHFVEPEQSGVFLCNAVHWLIYDHRVRKRTPRFAAAFDIGTEEFRLLPLPKHIKNDHHTYFNLHVLDGCLCFSCKYEDNFIMFLEFWIMREYGTNKSNWVKLMRVEFDSKSHIWTLKPILFSENGKLLLVYIREYDHTQTLAWYDLETGLLKRKVDNLPGYLGVPHFYIPTLLNPDPDHAHLRS